jgi:hypothetical protein
MKNRHGQWCEHVSVTLTSTVAMIEGTWFWVDVRVGHRLCHFQSLNKTPLSGYRKLAKLGMGFPDAGSGSREAGMAATMVRRAVS